MSRLERTRRELARYEHPLVEFEAQRGASGVELVMRLKVPVEGVGEYVAPLHERDIASPRFAWQFQRYLYDCLHDYLVDMFTRNPQQLGESE
jgi:hypothetical protein